MNIFSISANIITVFHWVAFIIFPIVGVFLSVSGKLKAKPKVQKLFVNVLLITAISFFIFKGCLLTKLEQYIRIQAGETSYTGGLIAHYLKMIGVYVSDSAVFYFMAILILTGIISEVYWNKDKILNVFLNKKYE